MQYLLVFKAEFTFIIKKKPKKIKKLKKSLYKKKFMNIILTERGNKPSEKIKKTNKNKKSAWHYNLRLIY